VFRDKTVVTPEESKSKLFAAHEDLPAYQSHWATWQRQHTFHQLLQTHKPDKGAHPGTRSKPQWSLSSQWQS